MNLYPEGRSPASRKSVIIKSFITSTAPSTKYNGLSLPAEVMYEIAESIRDRRTTLGIEHDRKHDLSYRILKSEVRETSTGSLGVWVEMEMDEEDWEKVGDKRGFSVTLHQPFHLPDPEDKRPKITIAIDPAYVDPETSKEVIAELELHCAVKAHHLLQYSDLSPVSPIVVTITLATQIAGGLIVAAICTAVKKLSAPKNKKNENHRIQILIEKGDTKIFVDTEDPHLKESITKLILSESNIQKAAPPNQIGSPNNHRKNLRRKKRH